MIQGTLSIGDINVGKKSPIIESISLRPSTPESHVQFEANFYFQPDTKLTIFAHFLNSNLELSSILLRGKVLVDLQFNQLYPMKSTCTISIMEDPVLDFTLKVIFTIILIFKIQISTTIIRHLIIRI